ncbi:MAG: hypothetical protein LBV60_07585 [Streptomyces sp.]|jgi:ACR3 family arsenite efflux pump ArsB|nr:hypothetical protein [Streptomyces sp.]
MYRRLIGLLLLVVAGAIAAALVFSNLTGGSSYPVSFLGQHVSMNTLALLCTGLALGFLVSLGLALMLKGRRHRRRGARGTHAGDAEAPRPT